MDFNELKEKAVAAAGGAKDKIEDLATSAKEKVEGVLKDEERTDAILDKAAGIASRVTGGKLDDKIDNARDAADKKLGSE